MALHSSTLAWKIPWTEESGRLQSMGSLRDTIERLHFHFSLSCIGGGNGNPLQCSCLENPRDGGALWAALYGIAQSRTWLKRLSSSSSKAELRGLSEKPLTCCLTPCNPRQSSPTTPTTPLTPLLSPLTTICSLSDASSFTRQGN